MSCRNSSMCISGFLLIAAFCYCIPFAVSQPAWSSAGPAIEVRKENIITIDDAGIRSGLLYDAETRQIVWSKDIDYAYPIASLTKMMVALLVLEDIQNCHADWNDKLELKSTIVRRIKRKKVCKVVTDTYTLDAMLHLAMIVSHNEACNVIARHLSGSVEAFVERMNARAGTLGMTNTFFTNPSGLPAPRAEHDNSSSARDILILALELLKYPELIAITRIGYDEIASERNTSIYRNHNRLVIDFENEVDGLKTGFTRNARYCLAASANKNNRRLIAVAIGAPSKNARADFVASLFTSYYDFLGIGRLGMSNEDYTAYLGQKSKNSPVISEGKSDTRPQPVIRTVWSRERIQHTVKAGETLTSIALKYGCNISSIKKWNKLKSTHIARGQKLLVYTMVKKQIQVDDELLQPGDSEEDDSNPEKSSVIRSPVSGTMSENKRVHVVQPGDTLWNIARRYSGLTVEDLKKWNQLDDKTVLKPGMKLKVSN